MKIGLGLIGTGRHGARYAEHIKGEVEDAELVAASRRDEEGLKEFGAKYGVARLYTDYADLIEDPDVDAVLIVTPNHLHMPIAVAAAGVGKHILVEKPMARNVEEAERMVEAAKAAGVKLMVSQNFRYHPLVRRVKELLAELGQPYFISMCKRQQPARGWREDPAYSGGGALMDLGVHVFDQARFLLDAEPLSVSCLTSKVKSEQVEDSFASLIEFPGCLVSCDASMCSGSRADLIEVATDGRQLLADRYARKVVVIDGFDRAEQTITQPDFTLGFVLKDFVRSVVDDVEPPITGRDGLRAVEMAQACYESARTGARVRI